MEFNIIKKITRGKFVGREQEICDLYFNQGMTLVETSKKLGCDNKFIRTFFKNNNLKTRGIGGNHCAHKNIRGNESDIISLYNSGWSSKDIGDEYGVDLGAILNCLKRHNVKIRSLSEAGKTDRVVSSKRAKKTIKFDQSTTDKIISLYEEGYSATHIGELYNCDMAVIRRIIIGSDITWRGYNYNTDITKSKRVESLMSRYGSWENRNKYLNQKFQEKYGEGLTGAMQVEEFFHKNQKSGTRVKNCVINGATINYRGYELRAICKLLKEGYEIGDIKTGKGMPTFRYSYDGRDNRVYYPDIYIPKYNRIIEVKSVWTYNQHLDKNLAKADAVKNAGYNFDFYIMDKNDSEDLVDL